MKCSYSSNMFMFRQKKTVFDKKGLVTFDWVSPDEEHELNKPFEFEWKANRNYCLTMKSSMDFECEEATNVEDNDNKFLPFALLKSGLTVVKYYKSEDGPDKDDAWADCPHCAYLFLWDRKGTCVNGAY